METIAVGGLRCRPMIRRGKRGEKNYWRIWNGEKNLWNGWATADEVSREAGRLLNFHGVVDRRGVPQTVGDLLGFWKAIYGERKDISDRTKEINFLAVRHLLSFFSDLGLDRLVEGSGGGAGELEKYRDFRLSEGASPSVINLEYRRLKQAWIFGQNRNWIRGSLPELSLNWYGKYNHSTPSDLEIEAVIQSSSGWLKNFLMIAYLTGARLSEVGNLRWSDIHLSSGTISFSRKRSGGRGKRTLSIQVQAVPIPDRLRDYLSGLPLNREPLEGYSRGSIGRMIARLCRSVGVPVFTPHGLRRATVVRMRRSGVSVVETAELLSNSPGVIWRHYESVSADDLRGVVDRVYSSGISVPVVSESVSLGSDAPREKEDSTSDWVEEMLQDYRCSTDNILHPRVQPAAVHRVPAGLFDEVVSGSVSESEARVSGGSVAPAVGVAEGGVPCAESEQESLWVDWSEV